MWMVYLVDTKSYPHTGYISEQAIPVSMVGVDERGNVLVSECIRYFPTETICPW